MDDTKPINKVQKGYRREKIVIDSYTDKGFIYYKPPKTLWGDKDVFNLFDILVYCPSTGELEFISVKSTYASKKHKKDLADFIPKKISIGLVEFRGKNKGNEKITVFSERDTAQVIDMTDIETDLIRDEHPVVIQKIT